MKDQLALRVASRFQRRLAEQPPGQKQQAQRLTQPINRQKGISRAITKDYGESEEIVEEAVTPHRRDIEPEDVFKPHPKDTGVLNFAQSGKDLQNAIENQIPKDKGYETVKNLSQYLIRTDGGGEGGPAGKPLTARDVVKASLGRT